MNDKTNDQPNFSDLMTGVKKIEHDRINVYRHRRKKTSLPKTRSRSAALDPDFASIDYQQRSGIRESQFDMGIQKKLQRKIRQGQLTIEDSLDLHGYNQNQATAALVHFFQQALASQFKMLVIIHGKGHRSDSDAVLKPLVRHWLAQQPAVLAWCPAQPKHGGDGASYVYLRNWPVLKP
ncbi:MAG: Smr/MutS family protein [Gammaproteobacteria bacterium]|nr:Smr/MutS family protein [Gammaproteobacteria bacterium]